MTTSGAVHKLVLPLAVFNYVLFRLGPIITATRTIQW